MKKLCLTSQISPVNIFKIVKSKSAFIAISLCPGKKIEGRDVIWDRDIKVDFDYLLSEGITTLVPLLEDHEFRRLKIEDYFKEAKKRMFDVIRFPIEDVSVPLCLEDTRRIVRLLCKRFKNGERILIHCNGGIGRAGTIAACVLLELGKKKTAEDAISDVREKRGSRAVEVLRQEHFVEEYERFEK